MYTRDQLARARAVDYAITVALAGLVLWGFWAWTPANWRSWLPTWAAVVHVAAIAAAWHYGWQTGWALHAPPPAPTGSQFVLGGTTVWIRVDGDAHLERVLAQNAQVALQAGKPLPVLTYSVGQRQFVMEREAVESEVEQATALCHCHAPGSGCVAPVVVRRPLPLMGQVFSPQLAAGATTVTLCAVHERRYSALLEPLPGQAPPRPKKRAKRTQRANAGP
jgi:hypothetical protein